MTLAFTAFRQIFIMLILMMIGVLCSKTKLIDEQMNNKLSSFLLFLVTPVVIFKSFQREYEPALLNGLLLSLLLSFGVFLLCFLVAYVFNRKNKNPNREAEIFACIYPNAGFIGIPLINGVLGSEGVFYLTVYIVVFNFFNWTHGVMLMSGTKNKGALKKVLLTPGLLATFVGLSFFLLQIHLPDVLLEPLDMINNMNTPLAMLVSGYALSRTSIFSILKNKMMYIICALRLLVTPLLVILILSFLPNIPELLRSTFIIVSACPIGVTIVLFSYTYKKDYIYATELMVASTILSMFTIPLVILVASLF